MDMSEQVKSMQKFMIQDESLIVPLERMERALLVIKQRTRRQFNKQKFSSLERGAIQQTVWAF
jgi:hypothetical protein